MISNPYSGSLGGVAMGVQLLTGALLWNGPELSFFLIAPILGLFILSSFQKRAEGFLEVSWSSFTSLLLLQTAISDTATPHHRAASSVFKLPGLLLEST